MKSTGSTSELRSKLRILSLVEEDGIPGVAVECVDIRITPVAKAVFWATTDAEARKLGERTGLDTLVVLAVNDGY